MNLKLIGLVLLIWVLKVSLSEAAAVPDQFLVQFKKSKIKNAFGINKLSFIQKKSRIDMTELAYQ